MLNKNFDMLNVKDTDIKEDLSDDEINIDGETKEEIKEE
jgi:hypothetical protein